MARKYHARVGQKKGVEQAYMREYMRLRRGSPEYKARERWRQLQAYRQLKSELLRYYSKGAMCCAACGFADMRALCLDHMADDGSVQRRQSGKQGITWFLELKAQGFPEGLQVLCANCNVIKASMAAERRRLPDPSMEQFFSGLP